MRKNFSLMLLGLVVGLGLTVGAGVANATLYTVCASGCTYGLSVSGINQAIVDATCGDVIQINAGETISIGGTPIKLKYKSSCVSSRGPHIMIRSSGVPNLTSGARVTPSDLSNLATFYADTGSTTTLEAEQYAEYYHFQGIEFTAHATFGNSRPLIRFGAESLVSNSAADNDPAQLPSNIIIEQCYLHGNALSTAGPRRGILAHTRKLIVKNSWFSDIKIDANESNAIGGWNTQGPIFLENNHLESASITTLFGGAVPNIQGIRINGFFVKGNHYYRTWRWRVREGTVDPTWDCMWDSNGGEYYKNTSTPSYWRCDSGVWTSILSGAFPTINYYQKNIFELKNAWRVWIEGNYFENTWQPAASNQYGTMFLFNLVDNDAVLTFEPAATVGHVVIQNNFGRRAPWLISLGQIGNYYLGFNNITMNNNVFAEIGDDPFTLPAAEGIGSKWGGGLFWSPEIGTNLFHTRNTVISRAPIEARTGYLFGSVAGNRPGNFVLTDNIFPWNDYGFYNDVSGGFLWNSLPNGLFPGYNVIRNVIVNNQSKTVYSKQSSIMNFAYNNDTPSAPMPCPASTNEITGSGATYNGNCGFPTAYSDVDFNNYSSNDYALKNTSPYLRWGTLGISPGANVTEVNQSTAGVSTDAAQTPAFLNFKISSITPSGSSLTFRYVAYDTSTCDVSVSLKSSMSSPTTVTDSGGALSRTVAITGLSGNTRYYWTVSCASGVYNRNGVTLTTP